MHDLPYTGGPGNNFSASGRGSSDAGTAIAASGKPYAEFNEIRWARVGADKATLAALRAEHAEMTLDERIAEGRWIASVSDVELRSVIEDSEDAQDDAAEEPESEPESEPEPDFSGTVEEVLSQVNGDPVIAAAALVHEQANKNRKTLIDALTHITGD